MKTAVAFGVLLGILCATVLVRAASEPTSPTNLTVVSTSTFIEDNYGPQSVNAIAGNITGLSIYGIMQTKAWQGYFGNITATITLDDASNYTFYNWSSAEPRGQVYATLNSSITWTSVRCFDFTNDSAAYYATMDAYYDIAIADVDSPNETYTLTNHPEFEVGSVNLTGCPTTYIFRDDTAQTGDFVNVLLFDPTLNDTGWIYATIIENKSTATQSPEDLTCYNGAPCDFQILVNENGHGIDTQTTVYYFWVELL